MNSYKFDFNDKTYELREDNCTELLNDLEHPAAGIGISDMIELLNHQEEHHFDAEYFDQPCDHCLAGKKEKTKFFKFLEAHFYIFTSKGEYVTSSISKGFDSYTKLLREGKADDSYIVSVIVCENCGHYSIEIEQIEV